MASISFGGQTLTNAHAGTPGSRFTSWAPVSRVVGPKHALLATGARRAWAFRTEHGATFTFAEIPNAQLATMAALALHLDGGGTVEVVTDDADARIYPTCGLMEGADPPVIELTDSRLLFYSMALSLVRLDGVAEPMLAVYP